MKKIEAIIRPEKLEPLCRELEKAGSMGMSVIDIEGHGRQGGVIHQWRGSSFKTRYLPKTKIELVVGESRVKKVTRIIVDVCRSGATGDGKIFISPVSEAVRIRTGARGEKALG